MAEFLDENRVEVTFEGQAWSKAKGHWIYYRTHFPMAEVRTKFELPSFIEEHHHQGTHDGCESGFICQKCGDAIMGLHAVHQNQSQNVDWT